MSYQRKLTVANVYGKIEQQAIPEKGELWLVRIYGHVNAKKEGVPSPYGDATAILGAFKWVNLATGEEFQSSRAYVPTVLLDEIQGQMSAENASVDFVVELGVKRSIRGSVGYEYVLKPVIHASGAVDPLKALEEKAAAIMRALPAPKDDKPKAPAGKRK